MHDGRFDPSGFYEFNLNGGHGTHVARGGERVVMLSEDVSFGAGRSGSARRGPHAACAGLGELLGEQILGRASIDLRRVLSPEAVLGHTSAVTALCSAGDSLSVRAMGPGTRRRPSRQAGARRRRARRSRAPRRHVLRDLSAPGVLCPDR